MQALLQVVKAALLPAPKIQGHTCGWLSVHFYLMHIAIHRLVEKIDTQQGLPWGFPVSRSYLRASQAWITMGYDGPISSLRYGHNPLFYCWGSLWDFFGAKPVSLEEYAKAHKLPKWQRFWNTGKARLSEWQKQVHHYPFGYASRCVPDTGLRSAALIWELHRHWKLWSCWGLRDAVNCKCYLWPFVFYLCSFGFNLVQT